MEQSETKVKTYTLVFTDEEKEVPAGSFTELCNYIFQHYTPETEPETIILPAGEEIEWNAGVINAFAAKGRITEKEVIQMLKK